VGIRPIAFSRLLRQPFFFMRREMTGTRVLASRGGAALLITILTSLTLAGISSAQPTQSTLQNAQARLNALNSRLSLLDEQYNQALLAQQEALKSKDQAQTEMDRAQATADAAVASLSKRAAQAFTGVGTQVDILLGADTFAQFSDRLEFMDRLAQDDADLATKAAAAKQKAEWAAKRFATAAQEAADAKAKISDSQAAARSAIDQQQQIVSQIKDSLARQQAAREAAAKAAAQAAAQAAGPAAGDPTGAGVAPPLGGGNTNPPPPTSSGAAGAIEAAKSVLGTPYVWGGASPSTGFDCSGLTMWAWGQVGVSLVHSSAGQYASLPHVDRSQIQPGDLLFFYSPIHHVAIYLGGNQMIHSPHSGSSVSIATVYWQYFVGAARPG
jgi:cell wall-associated NlpC family hydrolase